MDFIEHQAPDEIDSSHHTHEHVHGHAHHEHHHEHHAAVDYTQHNRDHFNETAQTYDDIPFTKGLSKKIGAVILNEYPFDKDSTIVLDFACGTGLVSQELVPYAKEIVGVDISQGMVDQYNLRVTKQGIQPEKMHAVRLESDLTGEDGELDGQQFDVIVCSMAYHHFSSISNVTRELASHLKPSGVLFISDLVKSAEAVESMSGLKYVAHAGGFDEGTLRSVFDSAGLKDFSFRSTVNFRHVERDFVAFIGKGTKPAAMTG